MRTQDVATLLSSFVERCTGEKRDLDRARCRATTAYLRRSLPKRTFAFVTDDPAVIAVSDYDAAVKGYHVALAGCVACTKPITVGRSGEPRLVTVKVPDKDAETLTKAVSLSRNTFGFDSLAEAKQWLDSERPFLRAEFLFQPDAGSTEWTFAGKSGVALKLLGARIYNRCTGDVLVSKPPSTGIADRPAPGHEDPSCAGAKSPVARSSNAVLRARRPAAAAEQDADRGRDVEDPTARLRLLQEVPVARERSSSPTSSPATAPCSRSWSAPPTPARPPASA